MYKLGYEHNNCFLNHLHGGEGVLIEVAAIALFLNHLHGGEGVHVAQK